MILVSCVRRHMHAGVAPVSTMFALPNVAVSKPLSSS
jgi:hypothetical protein